MPLPVWLSRILMLCPGLDATEPDGTRSAPVMSTVPPVTITWSNVPAVLPLTSRSRSAPAASVKPLASVIVPGLVPGAKSPLAATLTLPFMVPVPPSVPSALTSTSSVAEPSASEPVTSSVPALIVVVPV